MTNKEKFTQLFNLMKENPDLPVVPMVYSEIVGCEGYGYWQGLWGEAHIDKYLCTSECVHFLSDGVDDMVEVERTLCDYSEGCSLDFMSDDALRRRYNELPWKKAIIVYIDLPEV